MGIGKIELSEAESIANRVREYISPVMDRVEVAGSIRRRKAIVGDIEICGIPGDREKLIKLIGNIGHHRKRIFRWKIRKNNDFDVKKIG